MSDRPRREYGTKQTLMLVALFILLGQGGIVGANSQATNSINLAVTSNETSTRGFTDKAQPNLAWNPDLAPLHERIVRLEARSDDYGHSYSRLETLVGLSGAVFGIIITFLVLTFGWRTEKAAARAAKDEIASARNEITQYLETSKEALIEVQTILASLTAFHERAEVTTTEISKAARMADEMILTLSNRQLGLSENGTQVKELKQAADSLKESVSPDTTADEFRVLIGSSFADGDWNRVMVLTSSMMERHAADVDTAFSLSYRLRAAAQLKDHQEEKRVYGRLANLLEDTRDKKAQEFVIEALLSMPWICYEQNRIDDVIRYYDTVIKMYEISKLLTRDEKYYRSIMNRGAAFAEQGDSGKALADYGRAIEGLREKRGASFDRLHAMTLGNRAARLLALGKGEESERDAEAAVALFGNSKSPVVKEQVRFVRVILRAAKVIRDASPAERAIILPLVERVEVVEYLLLSQALSELDRAIRSVRGKRQRA